MDESPYCWAAWWRVCGEAGVPCLEHGGEWAQLPPSLRRTTISTPTLSAYPHGDTATSLALSYKLF